MMSTMKCSLTTLLTLLASLLPQACFGHSDQWELEIEPRDGADYSVVRFDLPLGQYEVGDWLQIRSSADDRRVMGQVVPRPPGAGDESDDLEDEPPRGSEPVQLLFVWPAAREADSNSTERLQVSRIDDAHADRAGAEVFQWETIEQGVSQLRYGDRAVLRYMHHALDESSPEHREETYKVYHHVFDPEDSERLVTKGTGGLYPHHRGIYYGFNRITYGQHSADTWHCNRGESQTHDQELYRIAGPVEGRHGVQILWRGRDGQPFIVERREVGVIAVPGGHLIEFRSELAPAVDQTVYLDGDPQHAGVQFRASQHVAEVTPDQTYYLRPDGRAAPGQFRNWSDRSDESPENLGHENLPWNAISFVIDDHRFTCVYIDHPDNPKPARYSERDYGRFGSYFVHALLPDEPLVVTYRFWLQRGEMDVADANALADDFAQPLAVRRVDDRQ